MNRTMSPAQRSHGFLYTGLIATMPLFSVRLLPGGISIPLLFFLALAGVVFLGVMSSRQIPAIFSSVDNGLLFYLFAALLTLAHTANSATMFAIFKSVIYFVSYLGLKMALAGLTGEQIKLFTRRGLVIGTILFSAITVLALQRTHSLGLLSQGLSYNSVTARIFSAIDTAFGQGRESFTSANVMRNAVGESFAFYALLGITLGFRSRLLTAASIGFSILFTLGMFSRRAVLAIGLGVFGIATQRGVASRRVAAIGGLFAVVLFAMGSSGDTRLTDFSDAARTSQYSEALIRFAASPFLGEGYGAKLEADQYVHNFVLAGMMMMGIFGLLATLAVFVAVLVDFLQSLLRPATSWTSTLLIIPLLGMAVGSTVEGILTLTGWVAIALHDVCRRQSGLEQELGWVAQDG